MIGEAFKVGRSPGTSPSTAWSSTVGATCPGAWPWHWAGVSWGGGHGGGEVDLGTLARVTLTSAWWSHHTATVYAGAPGGVAPLELSNGGWWPSVGARVSWAVSWQRVWTVSWGRVEIVLRSDVGGACCWPGCCSCWQWRGHRWKYLIMKTDSSQDLITSCEWNLIANAWSDGIFSG